MAATPDRNWSSLRRVAGWLLLAPALAFARQADQANRGEVAPEAASPVGDILGDALTCRTETAALPTLLARLRDERPDEFVQTDRQYSLPMMDLYRLQAPIQTWGNAGDTIAVTQNRVMLAVHGSMEEVSKRIDRELEASRNSPLPVVLDDTHALVVYPADQPGLEGFTLLGCEYRIDGLALLDNPADAWRKAPTPAGASSVPSRP
ncbi:MAG TPA: hypothetical protein VFF96_08145 [Pseudoxanthomonas sp.]|nr:hypothetical protein [Pseudoxanthomonas sp.]